MGTVDAVARALTEDGFVLRYRTGSDRGDGLPGKEGSFLACSFWLADALHSTGRQRAARKLCERLLDLRNDLGLLAEEYDPPAVGISVTLPRRSATSGSLTLPDIYRLPRSAAKSRITGRSEERPTRVCISQQLAPVTCPV